MSSLIDKFYDRRNPYHLYMFGDYTKALCLRMSEGYFPVSSDDRKILWMRYYIYRQNHHALEPHMCYACLIGLARI